MFCKEFSRPVELLGDMQFQIYLYFLAKQHYLASALQVIDNGIGPAVYGAEDMMVDYAYLADDQNAALPSQVGGCS